MKSVAQVTSENPDMASYSKRHETSGIISASAESAFEYLDDPRRLSSHMGKSSWMMMGSKMDMALDAEGGKKIGSEIVLSGKMMGMGLFVRERVTERVVPQRKTWETFGEQKMLVIEQYRMGFRLEAVSEKTKVAVFIEYDLPTAFWGRFLGWILGGFYARWCTQKMVDDAVRHFSPASSSKDCCH